MAIPTPVAFWKLDNTNDELGTYNLTNTWWVTFSTWKIWNAAYFDWTNKRLSVANTVWFSSSSTNTWAFWAYLNSTAGTQYLFDLIDTSTTSRVIVWYNASKFTLYASWNTLTTTWTFSISNYYFIRVTKTSWWSYELFIDEASQGTVSQGITSSTPTIFSIGSSGDWFWWNSNSIIDAFWAWTVVLTTWEGAELYNWWNWKEYPFFTFVPKILIC